MCVSECVCVLCGMSVCEYVCVCCCACVCVFVSVSGVPIEYLCIYLL